MQFWKAYHTPYSPKITQKPSGKGRVNLEKGPIYCAWMCLHGYNTDFFELLSLQQWSFSIPYVPSTWHNDLPPGDLGRNQTPWVVWATVDS